MSFVRKLKELKKNLKPSSIDTYLRNVRRLRKVEGTLPIPDTASWLTKKSLIGWYDKQSLSVRRHLATAALVALQTYGKKSSEWDKRQKAAMKEFDDQRRKRVLSDKQRSKMPTKGFAALKRVITNMRRELKHILSKPSSEWNLKEMLRVQDMLIISLYHDHPLRLDYAGLNVGKNDKNCIYKNMSKPKGWHVQLVAWRALV